MTQISNLYRRLLIVSMAAAALAMSHLRAEPEDPGRVFELRTYTTFEGKLDDLNARFRNHSIGLLKRHGADVIGFWVPQSEPESQNTLVYIVAFPSMAERDRTWHNLFSDPEWKTVKADSERNGKIVKTVVSQMLVATDYSPVT